MTPEEDSLDLPVQPPITPVQSSDSLREAVQRYNINLDNADQLSKLEDYCRLLWRWNEKINLTRHTSFDMFARRDLLDTVRLAAHIDENQEVLDLGTGGGVPGIVLAILRPDLEISLCESVGKKAMVAQQIVEELDLPIPVYPQRVQLVLRDLRFHTIVTRATGSITQLLQWLSDHWTDFDTLLAIKGPKWVEERGEARHRGLMHNIDLRCLESYLMPETQSQSAILSFMRKRS